MLRGPKTEIIEFENATILPGIVDAHVHLPEMGQALHEADLRGATSFDDAVRRTVEFARKTADRWIIGAGWDQNLWAQKNFPAHDALSAAVPDRPVVLRRIDNHVLVLNQVAMQLAGITNATADPPGGRIVRDASGAATGIFVDNALDLIYPFLPPASHEQLLQWTRTACAEANRFGVTAVGEANTSSAMLAAFTSLAERAQLSLRIHTMLRDNADLLEEHFSGGPVHGAYDGRLSVRAVKMFADGALGSHGAALFEPYADAPGNRGLELTTEARIADVTRRALLHGFQVCVHAIGDRANRLALDAYESALETALPGDYRLRIEHAQVLSPQDVPRFETLGVIPSMQTSHRLSDVHWLESRLGPQRARDAFVWRSLLDTGAIVANGTDAPVEPIDPRRTFSAAITPDGMSRDEALRSMTIWPAFANFAEQEIGSITPGKYADFVVMDRDWLREPVEAIMQTEVLATYVAGQRVHG
ncbi:MAG: amidohydrolase [Candidatus Eremiobacteraeota bacterium]|nr:amidohydrolase [Candidatus Eremiobacteraeota bacterium]